MENLSVFKQSLTTKDDRGLETEIPSYGVSFKDFVLNQQGISLLHTPLGPTIEATVSNRSALCWTTIRKKTQTKGGSFKLRLLSRVEIKYIKKNK